MTVSKVTPFIVQLQDMAHLMNDSDRELLLGLIPEGTADLDRDATNLESILSKLYKTADRLNKLATMADDTDALKVAAASLKQVLDVAVKYTDKIEASKRALHIENALVDAVESFDSRYAGFKTEFLAYLKEALK